MADIHQFEPLFGKWKVDELIGKGRYGNVYKVSRNEYGNTYYSAIKHVSVQDEGLESDLSVEQKMDTLVREININHELRGNSNLVCYEDHDIVRQTDGSYEVFIRMELLTSLSRRVEERPFTLKDTLTLGMDICRALTVLEQRNIIHRDIKPANLFCSEAGNYKLGDFGVARSLGGTTSGMTVAGTFNYMAPEVYHGGSVNHTADIYSLGMVLYRFTNGNRGPFLPLPPAAVTYEDGNAALSRRMNGEALPAPAFAPPRLAQCILRACAYSPEMRWQTAEDFRRSLSECLQEITAEGMDETVAVSPSGKADFSSRSGSGSGYPGSGSVSGYGGNSVSGGGSSQNSVSGYSINYSTVYENSAPGPAKSNNNSYLTLLIISISVLAIVLITVLVLVLTGVIGPINSSRSEDSTLADTADTGSGSGPSDTADAAAQTPETAPVPAEPVTRYYTVSTDCSAGGSVVPGGSMEYEEGESCVVQIVPDRYYEIDDVTVNGVSQGAKSRLIINSVNQDTDIYVSFRQVWDLPYGHSYEVVKSNCYWSDAADAAYSRGGYLATVNSQDEMDYLVQQAESQGIHVLFLGGMLDWADQETYYQYPGDRLFWLTGEPVNFQSWMPGEPNNDDGEEFCLSLMKNAKTGKWGFCDVPDYAVEYYNGRNILGYAIEWED